MPLISVLIPLCNEEENISKLYQRLRLATRDSVHDFEFIFIDDGSTDDSFSLLKKISSEDRMAKIIKLSRNFGSHAACMAGIRYAKGDACMLIPADLQDPPELIPKFIEEWEKGYEVVFGVKEEDKKSNRILPDIYYYLVRKFALKNMPKTGIELFLIDKKVINAITAIREKNTSIYGLILWSGFNQKVLTFKKGTRYKGISKWTFSKKLEVFIDTFVSFSYFPIRIISLIGILFALIGFLYASFIVFERLFWAVPIEGWASLMVVLLVVSGIQLSMLGILGEYLWRNFDETRKRPPFIVKDLIGFEGPQES